jgi:hypothetical protein
MKINAKDTIRVVKANYDVSLNKPILAMLIDGKFKEFKPFYMDTVEIKFQKHDLIATDTRDIDIILELLIVFYPMANYTILRDVNTDVYKFEYSSIKQDKMYVIDITFYVKKNKIYRLEIN